MYNWPGNVRELRNFVETAIILNKGEVVTSDFVSKTLNLGVSSDSKNLPVPLNMPHDQAEREIIYRTLLALKLDINEIKQMLQKQEFTRSYEIPTEDGDVIAVQDENELRPTTLASMEREMIKQTLKRFGGSRRKTARALQISERTLYRKIKEYGL